MPYIFYPLRNGHKDLKGFRRFFGQTKFSKAKPLQVDKQFALENFKGPIIAIVGRPNVGKSSLFNRLAGREVAIVHKTAGVTRDRKVGQGYLSDLRFIMVDTPGFEEISRKETDSLKSVRKSMVQQADLALQSANAALFVVDAKDGLTSDDYSFAKWLQIKSKQKDSFPIELVANKSETKSNNSFTDDVYSLRMGEPAYVSAKHNQGMADLYSSIKRMFDKIAWKDNETRSNSVILAHDEKSKNSEEKDPLLLGTERNEIQLAIIGRPNVGKSTLMNSITRLYSNSKEDRVITSEIPNTTRDSIAVNLNYKGTGFKLIDTAGITGPNRMSWRNDDKEKVLAMDQTLSSIGFANIVCMLVQIPSNLYNLYKKNSTPENLSQLCKTIFSRKDLNIAKKVMDEGRALIIALNKIDLIPSEKNRPITKENGKKTATTILEKIQINLKDKISSLMSNVGGTLEVISISALKEKNIEILLDQIQNIHSKWTQRMSTALINKWINEIFRFNPPPKLGAKMIKIRFITQIKARPPTFVLFTNRQVPENYQKFLKTKMREEFDFNGVPVRLLFKMKENPFILKGKGLTKNMKRNDKGKRVVVSPSLKKK